MCHTVAKPAAETVLDVNLMGDNVGEVQEVVPRSPSVPADEDKVELEKVLFIIIIISLFCAVCLMAYNYL